MKKLLQISLAVSGLLFAVIALNASPIPLSTTTEFTSTAIARFRAYHGETVRLTHRLTLAGAPLDLSGASARFYWRTEEMADWWSTDATLEADSVWCDFTPEMDPGTEAIWYFFGITQENAIAYRANGSLTLLDSPGFTPADLGEPDALAAALEALFKEADTRYTTKEELTANSQQLTAHSEQLTAHSEQLTDLEDAIATEATTRETADADIVAALEQKAEANHTHADLVKQSDVQQVLNESELPVSAKAVYQNVGNVVRNPDIADVVRYVDAGSLQEIGDQHGKAIFAADSDGQGGIIVGGSRTSQPCWTQWTAKLNWDKIRAYNDPGLYEDYSFKPSESNQIARMKDLALKQDKLTAGENITIENGVISAAGGKVDVDSELSFQSTNPVQNKVVTSNLYRIDGAAVKFNASPSAGFEEFKGGSGRVFTFRDDRDHAMEMGIKEGKIAWMDGDGTKHEMTLGCHTEVWKGNVGFGEQDTFFGPRRVAEGEGQFYKGYPRLHNHGQDIHEVSGFSRDSRDDESVWSHRLLLPWDLAKANDTSYLMAGVVWNGNRNLFANGDTATFVQPLLPQNSGSTQSALPYAIPCFENSPVYWKGTIIWNDGTQAISKAVQIPWARVTQDMRGPDELALKRDIPSIDAALSTTSTNPVQNKVIKAALDTTAAVSFGSMPSVSLGKDGKYFNIQSADSNGTIGAEITYPNGTKVVLVKAETVMDLATRVNALESAAPSEPEAPTLEVATWSGTVCSVPWGANPLLIDCSGQTEHDFTIQFPVADWPEGATRLLFIRATPTPTVGDGIIDSVKGGNGLLTPSVVGYDYLEQGEEHTVSAWRRGSRLRLMVVDRERLSDL